MGDNLTETEIKILVHDLDAIRARLAAAGAKRIGDRVLEHNVRYEDADETLTPGGIVLRLRHDRRTRLTYKGPGRQDGDDTGKVLTRFEAEVTVDDFDMMDLILQRLGFHPYLVYEKYRTTYQLGAAEIVLDEMPFGTFMEIEGPAAAIGEALAALEMAGAPRILGSYIELFQQVKDALDLDMHDLTFENFKGIDVPPGVFAQDPAGDERTDGS